MLTDGRTDAWTNDGQKVITIAHPEQSSGELKKIDACGRLFIFIFQLQHSWTFGFVL